ncbi:MAG: tetratricopeptide repeat protein [Sedimentisphaerales bacterium]
MSNDEGKNNNQPDGQGVKLTSIFNEAIRIESPSERDAFVKSACGDDTALLTRVEALLKVYLEDKGHHKSPQGGLNSTLETAPVIEGPGTKIGRFKLLQLIGEGGCGVVYMAEQERPIRRRVAFKIIKLGMDTKQVIARFEAERQALALMDHPNIAKVLDAGSTETGRPYFVMELVRGIKITDYCDQNNLSTEQRLELFVQICHAVQHAHQKGIIHRDIKPSNILVTLHDGVPVPKIIDFGIAKATTGQMLTDKTLFTAYEQFIGTPAYMSPEQAEMSGLDVDTRSDIYALGVLLYELLTGQTPFDAKELAAVGLNEMRKIIREKEPLRPSTRISSLNADDQTMIAKRRHSEPPQLIHVVRGDLDWIVMKCLEKDRTRRYETANGLAHDVLNYLNNETVTARPPSRVYRLGKLVRRNKLVFASAALITAALVVGLGLSTLMFFKEKQDRQQAVAAEKKALAEAAKSQQVAQFLKDMLKGVGPSVAMGRDTTMLLLDKTAERVGKDLKNSPEVEADLRSTIGEVYMELGQYTEAEEMHRAALALRRALWGNMNTNVADSLENLADALEWQTKPAEAEPLVLEVLTIRTNLLGKEHLKVAECLATLGKVRLLQGRYTEAEELCRHALAMRRKLSGNESMDVAYSLSDLSWALFRQRRLQEAEAAAREAVGIQKKLLGEEGLDPHLGESKLVLGLVLLNEGKPDEAETTLRPILAMRRKLVGSESLLVAHPSMILAIVLNNEGKLDEAEQLGREALATFGRLKFGSTPEGAFESALCMYYLGEVLHKKGKLPEAEAMFRECLSTIPKLEGQWAIEFAWARNQLATMLREEGKLSEAEVMYREAIELQRKSKGNESGSVQLLDLLAGFADLLRDEGKLAEAEPLYREGLDLCRRLVPNDFERRQFCVTGLGTILRNQGKLTEAESLYRETLEARRKLPPSPDLVLPLTYLADFLRDEGKLAEAEPLYREGLDLCRQLEPNNYGRRQWCASGLGDILRNQGKLTEAESLYRETLEAGRKSPPSPDLVLPLARLGDVLRDEGKLAEAEPLYREGLDLCRRLASNSYESRQWTASGLGFVLRKQGKFAEAEPFYREAIENAAQAWPNDVAKWKWQVNDLVDVLRHQGKQANAEEIISEVTTKK